MMVGTRLKLSQSRTWQPSALFALDVKKRQESEMPSFLAWSPSFQALPLTRTAEPSGQACLYLELLQGHYKPASQQEVWGR